MAQTGFTPLLVYGSTTPSNVPLAANLTTSASGVELAVNAADGKLFYKDSGGTVQVLATKGTGAIGGSNTQVQYNSSGSLAGSANLTFDGTTLTANALTTTSTVTINGGTANGVAYLNASKVLTTGSALVFDGSSLGLGTSNPAAFAAKFMIYGNVNSQNLLTIQDSGTSYGPSKYYQWFINSAGAGAGWFAHTEAQGIGLGSESNLLFYSGGATERMRLDSSGNLGLGVTPSAWGSGKAIELGQVTGNALWGLGINSLYLTSNARWNGSNYVYTNNGAANLYGAGTGNGSFTWFNAASGTAGAAITFTQAMTLDASGNLGIGVTSPGAKLEVYGGASGTVTNIQVGNASTAFVLGVDGSNNCQLRTAQSVNMLFYTAATERARIDTSGNLLVKKTSYGGTATGIDLGNNGFVGSYSSATTSSSNSFAMYSNGASAYRFYVDWAGTVFATNTTISAISDQRFKENIQDLDVGLDKIMALKPRKFDWKAGKGKDIKGDRGFIAQEFEQVFPDLIDEWKDPAPEGEEPYKSVRQDLIPVLVKALQELKAEVDSLKAQLKGA